MAAKVILLASPVFFVLIFFEFLWGLRKGRNTYALSDTINSLSLGILSQITAFFGRSLRIGLYVLAYQWLQPHTLALQSFWHSALGWLAALLLYDLCYYWLHRLSHESAILWAAHVVHHQSQHYNLSTALRQTSSGFLLGWIFYLPLALLGVPPEIFAVVALIDLLYQFWVHTEHIGKLGWFDRVFCSPSNHRVHHAINDHYLDKNYGGILVIWDKLFGTFKEESTPCIYGTRTALRSWDPLWANLEVYAALAQSSWRARGWQNKLKVWLKPPGWKPDSAPTTHLSLANDGSEDVHRAFVHGLDDARYDPPLSRTHRGLASLAFLLALAGGTMFLDQAKHWAPPHVVWACLGLSLWMWALGHYLQAFRNSSLPPSQ
jgi:alkylglycerol monooxygenase